MESKGEPETESATESSEASILDFEVACPKCGQEFKCRPEHIGSIGECTACEAQFAIQAPGSPPAPSRQASTPSLGALSPTPVLGGGGLAPEGRSQMCSMHPEVPALRNCAVCRAPICATCDFAFAGGAHVCPSCASKPQTGVGERRKNSLIWSYVFAIWSTVGLAVLLSGALSDSVTSESELEALGLVISIFVFIPSLVGTALAVGSLDRRLSNPPSIWVSVVWNAIILVVLLLLTVVGSFQ